MNAFLYLWRNIKGIMLYLMSANVPESDVLWNSACSCVDLCGFLPASTPEIPGVSVLVKAWYLPVNCALWGFWWNHGQHLLRINWNEREWTEKKVGNWSDLLGLCSSYYLSAWVQNLTSLSWSFCQLLILLPSERVVLLGRFLLVTSSCNFL